MQLLLECCDTNDDRQQIPLLWITRYDGRPAWRRRLDAAILVISILMQKTYDTVFVAIIAGEKILSSTKMLLEMVNFQNRSMEME